MKLTKSKLKQVIKEELQSALKETFGAESAEDPRAPLERVVDQMEATLENWSTHAGPGDTEHLEQAFRQAVEDLRNILAEKEKARKEMWDWHYGGRG